MLARVLGRDTQQQTRLVIISRVDGTFHDGSATDATRGDGVLGGRINLISCSYEFKDI